MTTVLAAPATREQAPALDLDARLALVGVEMDGRLGGAGLTFDVNTARIPAEPTFTPDRPVEYPAPARQVTYRTPLAACLQRAQHRLEDGGWCAGTSRDEQGAVCLMQAIRSVAHSRAEADDACVHLLDVIRAEFDPAAETIPSWNDAQQGPRVPIRILGRGADRADARGI